MTGSGAPAGPKEPDAANAKGQGQQGGDNIGHQQNTGVYIVGDTTTASLADAGLRGGSVAVNARHGADREAAWR